MHLTVLGSNATFPTPGRPASGYLIEQGTTRIWVDAGSGTFAALQETMDFQLVDAVVLTHVHADHCSDLIGFYHALKFGPGNRTRLPVYCPEGLPERIVGFLGGPDHDPAPILDFRVQRPGDEVAIGPVTLRFALADHGVPTLAIRAEANGRVLAYSADTGPEGDWPSIATAADLFVCEATYQGPSDEKPWHEHLTAGEAGAIARREAVRRLMLTHVWPFLDPARSVEEAEATFGKPVAVAVPGLRTKV